MKGVHLPIMIMAGGTGGHVFPALAVANELRAAQVPVVWMGTRTGLEASVVPAAGIEIEWLNVAGLRGKGKLTLLLAPVRLLRACLQAWGILRRRRPGAVLGMGGFVSGPGGLVAWLSRLPLVVHEQNAIAGLTNRLLARFADRVLEAVPSTFAPAIGALHTGNPVRPEICGLLAPEQRMARRTGPLRLLVIGGSQGARALNELLPKALALLSAPRSIKEEDKSGVVDVRHQAGGRHLEQARQCYREAGIPVRLSAFIENMAEAYGWADVVLCRAGAMTVAELSGAGVGSILVPYPFAVDDHQTRNAAYLAKVNAALVIQEAALHPQGLAELLNVLRQDRSRLLAMACAARALAKPNAARRVAEVCLEVSR